MPTILECPKPVLRRRFDVDDYYRTAKVGILSAKDYVSTSSGRARRHGPDRQRAKWNDCVSEQPGNQDPGAVRLPQLTSLRPHDTPNWYFTIAPGHRSARSWSSEVSTVRPVRWARATRARSNGSACNGGSRAACSAVAASRVRRSKPWLPSMPLSVAWPPARMSASLPRAVLMAISHTVVAATATSSVLAFQESPNGRGQFGVER